jgi:hypothetical protein
MCFVRLARLDWEASWNVHIQGEDGYHSDEIARFIKPISKPKSVPENTLYFLDIKEISK